ncbi:hypothetical protein [Gandjariella thermophila]|uniref:Uncharacterized protein n=1 Tax=Gandjariella thermophila TaxID=1931992 RepID=A0A4D4JF84_9PSEU|nr:hypothetical protein [Gandjariella thermophila]GDY32979.1 hypothetical protein GTS_46120 [Gandjariella thermophila]
MTEQYTAQYVGGPLDGREDDLPESRAIPGSIVTHTYLHAGPKIETFYQLYRTDEGRWEYRLLRPR